jgi:hypothetical protein
MTTLQPDDPQFAVSDEGWQPAIVAPFDPLLHPDALYPEDWKSAVGKKVRVRPAYGKRCWNCGQKAYQIHPEDAPLVGCPFGTREHAYVCEHMILTD